VKVVLGDLDTMSGLGIYLAGTPLFVRIDSASIARGYLLLDSVPPGLMPRLLLYSGPGASPAGGTQLIVDEDLLTVSPGMITLANEDGVWRQYRRLYLNTSPTGAVISESMQWDPVIRFPLLVRLDSSNFDFAQARDSGQDLRFANAGGSPLPYEISRWDASAGRAEVWVRVDTIRGNNDSQYIEMYWGNPQALSRSDGASVFDTAYGFVSVLHLDAVPASDPTRHSDATANRLHGKGVNLAASDGVEGMVGIAQRFNGSNGYIEIPNSAGGPLNLPERSGYTVSAWVKADSLSARYQALIGKGGNQYNLQITPENMWRFVESEEMGVFEAVKVPAQSGVWRLLTGAREGAGMAIYVDGERVSGSLEPVEPAIRSESYNVSIGWNNQVAGQAFAGIIDEVIISNLPRGSDWIKLTFENQRPDQRLIQVRSR
jgi:hypothetical protein